MDAHIPRLPAGCRTWRFQRVLNSQYSRMVLEPQDFWPFFRELLDLQEQHPELPSSDAISAAVEARMGETFGTTHAAVFSLPRSWLPDP